MLKPASNLDPLDPDSGAVKNSIKMGSHLMLVLIASLMLVKIIVRARAYNDRDRYTEGEMYRIRCVSGVQSVTLNLMCWICVLGMVCYWNAESGTQDQPCHL